MRLLVLAVLALTLATGLGSTVSANDAHHAERKTKAKPTAKKATKKPAKQAPAPKTSPRRG